MFSLLASALGCDGDDGKKIADATSVDATPVDGGIDATWPDASVVPVPELGAMLDRMGRPAINTALTDPIGADADKNKDAYNKDSDQAKWAATWVPFFAPSLAIFDGLNTICGDQLLAEKTVSKTQYTPLAGALADDQLYLDATLGTCNAYLAVEAAFVGKTKPADCGGRNPLVDVIDASYSVLAGGSASVSDGIAKDDDGTASLTDFPFLISPK